MGGLGSGNRYRWGAKTCCEEVRHIDVHRLNKSGCLVSGYSGVTRWSIDGKETASIGLKTLGNQLKLSYNYSCRDSEKEFIEQPVSLVKTPCHYGGYRTWFVCGGCSKRVTKLYNGGKYFHCRKCYDLPYTSQNESKSSYLYTRKHKLGAKTFANYEFGEGWGKPKGQHWKTFEKNKAKYDRAEQKVNGHLLGFLVRSGLDRRDFIGL